MPDPIAEQDQALANIRDMAMMMVTYHRTLVEGGFDAQSALMMTMGYQQAIIQTGGANA